MGLRVMDREKRIPETSQKPWLARPGEVATAPKDPECLRHCPRGECGGPDHTRSGPVS